MSRSFVCTCEFRTDCQLCSYCSTPTHSPSNVISFVAKKKERNARVCGDGCTWPLPPLIEARVTATGTDASINETIELKFSCPLCGAEYVA